MVRETLCNRWSATCAAFERWLEPWLRFCGGVLVGRVIVWVPAGGPFRVWGLRGGGGPAEEATVGLLGGLAVVGSGVLPMLAAGMAGRSLADPTLGVACYLRAVPMTTVFVFRVLMGGRSG